MSGEGTPLYKSHGECSVCHNQMIMDQPKCMIEGIGSGYLCEHCQKHVRGQCTDPECPDPKGLYEGWKVLVDLDSTIVMMHYVPPKSWLEHELRYQEALQGYTEERIKRLKVLFE